MYSSLDHGAGYPVVAPPCGLCVGGEAMQLLFSEYPLRAHVSVKILESEVAIGAYI